MREDTSPTTTHWSTSSLQNNNSPRRKTCSFWQGFPANYHLHEGRLKSYSAHEGSTTLHLIFFELFNLSIRVLRKHLKGWENWAVARKATSDLPLYNSWALGFCTLACYILLPLDSKKHCMKQAIGRFSRFGYCSTAESSHISHQVGHTWRSLESLLMKAIEFQVIINTSMKILGWFRGISHFKGKLS